MQVGIQIQHLLKLNLSPDHIAVIGARIQIQHLLKLNRGIFKYYSQKRWIQIQHLLKLNARKINLYNFYYTIKSIEIQGFKLFFTSDNTNFLDLMKMFSFQGLRKFLFVLAGKICR